MVKNNAHLIEQKHRRPDVETVMKRAYIYRSAKIQKEYVQHCLLNNEKCTTMEAKLYQNLYID